jgi:hypothetical protein
MGKCNSTKKGARKMKSLMIAKAALIAVFLCVSGCSALETLGDYVRENPVFASVVTRQAVARYIGAKDTEEERQARAEDVTKRINKVALYLDGNPETTVDALMITIDAAIDWGELNPEDRLLVSDIVMLVEAELRRYEVENDPIDSTALIAIRGLFDVAISAAQMYLLKV